MASNDCIIGFSPEDQAAFWGALSPDLRDFFDYCELGEGWTIGYDETPESFIQAAKAIDSLSSVSSNENRGEITKKLIVVLSAMSMRECLSAMSWLDKNLRSDAEPGWAFLIYSMSCSMIEDKDEKMSTYARIIVQRIDVLIKMRLIGEMFSPVFGKKIEKK